MCFLFVNNSILYIIKIQFDILHSTLSNCLQNDFEKRNQFCELRRKTLLSQQTLFTPLDIKTSFLFVSNLKIWIEHIPKPTYLFNFFPLSFPLGVSNIKTQLLLCTNASIVYLVSFFNWINIFFIWVSHTFTIYGKALIEHKWTSCHYQCLDWCKKRNNKWENN